MTQPVVLDFETYWSQDYTLRRLSNEQYILDRQFQIHGCSVIDRELGVHGFLDLPGFLQYLKCANLPKRAVLSHNARFDMAILCWRLKILPGAIIDSMGMAQVFIFPYTGNVSLAKCATFLGRSEKQVHTLDQTKGLRTHEIRNVPGLWQAFSQYAVSDAEHSLAIWQKYWKRMPRIERLILDWSIRNYLRGRLRISVGLLQENLFAEQKARDDLLQELGLTSPAVLRSTKSFVEHLKNLGVTVEYKSNSKGVEIPAFAKDDDFMRTRLQDNDPRVSTAIRGRLAFLSSLELSRTQRILTMAQATGGNMLIPLSYHAARTGRFGGTGGINVQNLKKGSLIRRAIRAPEGHVLVTADASQIEARLVGWLAGCVSMTEAWREQKDLYAEFASVAFGRPVNRVDNPIERQTGKVSILQLGYQSGGAKLQKKLEDSGVVVDLATATSYVDTYRKAAYPEVPAMWYRAERLLRTCIELRRAEEFMIEGLMFTHRGIKLPSNRWLLYDQMRIDQNGTPEYYDTRYRTFKQLYGGRIIENISQSLARDVVTDVHVRFLEQVVMQEHDSLTLLVPEDRAQEYLDHLLQAMSETPFWAWHPATGALPLMAEGYISPYYAKPVRH